MVDQRNADEENAAGMAHVRAGRLKEAIPHFERASELLPEDELLRNNLGAALVESGNFERALTVLDAASARNPDYAEAHHNRGVALRGLGRIDEAIEAGRTAVRLRPDYADGLTGLGISLAQAGHVSEATAACHRALSLQPRSPLAALTLGIIFARENDAFKALEMFRLAISLNPGLAQAYHYAGTLLQDIGRRDEAIACFERLTELEGDNVEAFVSLGNALASKRRRTEAIASMDRALALQPDHPFARVQRLHLLAWQCNWQEIAKERPNIPSLGIAGEAVSPFAMLSLEDAPERHRIRSERFAEQLFTGIRPLAPLSPRVGVGKLRLGYFSTDFNGHAVSYLAARLFELHDRTKFEVHAFSYGRPTEDEMRQRLRKAFHEFHDVRHLSNRAAAQVSRDLGLDIAIDLNGYTGGQRLGIFAHNAAPLQVSFLGYPGTTGAPFMDYLVADPIVIPPSERACYTEQLIVLPHCYQPNDDQRPIGKQGSRTNVGLPEAAFVFASFNHSWKIGPEEFDCWADLLRKVDESVLWLLASDPEAEANLKHEMARRGVDPDRLVFAPQIQHQQHLGRLGHADLFLDTFTYGAHTTASDALWAGVPIVTCAGRGFATRVATSILHAGGLSELATESRSAYVELALSLARQPERLANIRERLEASRGTVPMFDTAGFARAFERGLLEAHRRAVAGEPPADIFVKE